MNNESSKTTKTVKSCHTQAEIPRGNNSSPVEEFWAEEVRPCEKSFGFCVAFQTQLGINGFCCLD